LIIQTDKLDLPSISEVQTRGPSDVPYYNHHSAQRPLYDRLPSLPLPQPQQAYSSGTSSPRVGSIGSLGSSILNGSSHSSYTTASSSNGPKTPSPTIPGNTGLPLPQTSYHNTPPSAATYSYSQEPSSYSTMNHPSQDMYYSQQHMSAGQPPQPQTVTSGGLHYPQHPQQPPLLQPGPAQYSPANSYNNYGYQNGLTSPQSSVPQVHAVGGQGNMLPTLPQMTGQPMGGQGYGTQQGFDTTGQVAPPGMKPRVTATLWEDEGSLCFQVEAKGVCVARREGKHWNPRADFGQD